MIQLASRALARLLPVSRLPGFFLGSLCLLLASSAGAAAPLPARGAAFESADCANFQLDGDQFECGYVSVPEFHAKPDGKLLKLAVAILPSTAQTPTRDALVIAQGGPGGSSIDTFARFFASGYYPGLETLRAERDIVLYDQRGTLYAQPALICTEELELTLETIAQELTPEERLAQSEAAALACRTRLVNSGIDLDAYNSLENALDIENLRRALGYSKFDFYGVSYGTLLALHGMRETPGTFRSVVLDAVVPTQVNPNVTVAQSQNRAFEKLFGACADDADCDKAYPNLGQVFYDLVDALNKNPVRVPIADDQTGKTYPAVLDGDTLMDLLFQFIYNSDAIPALPQMIYGVRDGNYDLIQVYWPLLAFDRTFASGMYYSVTCAEDADFTLDDLRLDGVDPHIARAERRDTAALLDLCRKWNVPPLGASADKPVRSDIPTLVLSGEYDPITPPPFGETAAASITPSLVYTFPAYGHGALTSGNCPDVMVATFIENPNKGADASCLRGLGPVAFITPSTYLLTPGLGRLQYAMLQVQATPFVAPLALMFVLTCVLVVAPLAWLVGAARKRRQAPGASRFAPWLAALAAVSASAFFVIWTGLVVGAALTDANTTPLVIGAPRSQSVIFLLPLLFGLCALGLVVTLAAAWRRGAGSRLGRIYYTFITLAAIGLVVWFWANGILTALWSF